MISFEVVIVRTAGSLRSRWWNGGEVKCAVISDLPESSATTPSGCCSETVYGSYLAYCSLPDSLIACICMMIAGIDTFTAVTAILSLGCKSFSDLRCGALVLRYIGIDVMAATPLTFMLLVVLSHSVMKAGGPAAA